MVSLAAVIAPTALIERRLKAWLARLQAASEPAISLAVELWNGRRVQVGGKPGVKIRVNRPAALTCLLSPSLDRIGEAYVEGDIDLEGSPRELMSVASRLASLVPRRSRRRGAPMARHARHQDTQDIEYHYDVSNEFYEAWLDQHMVYSCAYFRSRDENLESAQINKIDHILTKLHVQPGDRLLDIGCGWGALILRAASHFGARATGITLSRNQFDLARRRIAEAGLEDRCEVRLMDYRDLEGSFERITSVGMFEHVGLKNLPTYFRTIHRLLAPGGTVLNHGITSTDPNSGETPFGGGRFIDRYVFPNGELAHISLVQKEMEAAGLEVHDVENLRRHYALTLQHWSDRFEAASHRLREMVGERRYRIWRTYLAGCGYGFEHGWIALHQILATRAGDAAALAHLPLTREYMYPDAGAPSA
jgi:cyclopropane-fatty-acyl-phospholipid synthase